MRTTAFTVASYLDPGLRITSTLLISSELSCSSSDKSCSFLPLIYIRGVPLPKTSKASCFLVIPGILVNTSLAEPTLLNTLFSTLVTMASPFMRVTGRLPSTTTSPSVCASETSCTIPRFTRDTALHTVLYPMDEIFTI